MSILIRSFCCMAGLATSSFLSPLPPREANVTAIQNNSGIRDLDICTGDPLPLKEAGDSRQLMRVLSHPKSKERMKVLPLVVEFFGSRELESRKLLIKVKEKKIVNPQVTTTPFNSVILSIFLKAAHSLLKKRKKDLIALPEEVSTKVANSIKDIIAGKKVPDITVHTSQGNNKVFSVNGSPFVFKYSKQKVMIEKRYENIQRARAVCQNEDLEEYLAVPEAQIMVFGQHKVLVERQLDIEFVDEAKQEELFFSVDIDRLNKVLRALTIFVAKTEFSDLTFRNIPLTQGDKFKVALVDLEDFEGSRKGVIGDYLGFREEFDYEVCRGIVGCCVNKEQAERVIEIAKKMGIEISDDDKDIAIRRRVAEIKWQQKLHDFYQEKGIKTGEEIFDLERLESIDFSAYPNQEEKLKIFVKDLINHINSSISKNRGDTKKSRRSVRINTNYGIFLRMDQTLADENLDSDCFQKQEDYYEATFLGFATNALIQKKAIFGLIRRNGYGYYLQA